MPDIGELIHHYGYAAIILGSLLEGETVCILGGVAAHKGILSLPLVMACAMCGGIIGDIVLFWLGHFYGSRLIDRFGGSRREQIDGLRERIKKHQALAIFGIRFLYGLRIVGPVVIGASRVSPGIFMLFNILGAVVWAVLFVGGGYLFGAVFTHYLGNIEKNLIWLIPLMIVILVVVHWWRSRSSRQK